MSFLHSLFVCMPVCFSVNLSLSLTLSLRLSLYPTPYPRLSLCPPPSFSLHNLSVCLCLPLSFTRSLKRSFCLPSVLVSLSSPFFPFAVCLSVCLCLPLSLLHVLLIVPSVFPVSLSLCPSSISLHYLSAPLSPTRSVSLFLCLPLFLGILYSFFLLFSKSVFVYVSLSPNLFLFMLRYIVSLYFRFPAVPLYPLSLTLSVCLSFCLSPPPPCSLSLSLSLSLS